MKHYFPSFAALTLSLMSSAITPAMNADEWNKRTITIDQAIEVQDTVLPAGSYVIKLVDSPSVRNLVQIFNADEDRLITAVFAVPAYRFAPRDNSEFKFYESEAGIPPVLRTWFYPGDDAGFEFRQGRPAKAADSERATANTNASISGGD